MLRRVRVRFRRRRRAHIGTHILIPGGYRRAAATYGTPSTVPVLYRGIHICSYANTGWGAESGERQKEASWAKAIRRKRDASASDVEFVP
eukprot:COSAG06_NODE_1417_length_9526_cov_9.513207_13_plen_89_part_01